MQMVLFSTKLDNNLPKVQRWRKIKRHNKLRYQKKKRKRQEKLIIKMMEMMMEKKKEVIMLTLKRRRKRKIKRKNPQVIKMLLENKTIHILSIWAAGQLVIGNKQLIIQYQYHNNFLIANFLRENSWTILVTSTQKEPQTLNIAQKIDYLNLR